MFATGRPLFSFRAFGLPVQIETSALLIVGFIALSWGRGGTDLLALGVVYALVLMGSIFVHELGHAVVGARLGLQPQRIALHGFGGYCQYGRRPTPGKGVISSLAGPAAGLLLGGVLLVLSFTIGGSLSGRAAYLLQQAIFINIFWSLFNLLPMYPMDGGQALWHGLRLKISPLKADRIVKTTTIVTAVLAGIAGVLAGFFFIPLICFFAVMQARRL
ncbi:MAG: hypothetical protein H6742_05005 [Alphaproteobacteria bacterium]|nr:hypothetical protein [Alphaproteobacteria bacterium]